MLGKTWKFRSVKWVSQLVVTEDLLYKWGNSKVFGIALRWVELSQLLFLQWLALWATRSEFSELGAVDTQLNIHLWASLSDCCFLWRRIAATVVMLITRKNFGNKSLDNFEGADQLINKNTVCFGDPSGPEPRMLLWPFSSPKLAELI